MTSQPRSIWWGRTWAALAALSACLCAAALATTPADAATGSISGTVTDASSGDPIQGAEVCAQPFDSEEWSEFCAFTETDGTYFIGGLEPGSYAVSFWGGSEYAFEYSDGRRSREEADPVDVPSGGKATAVDADLDRTASIDGTVLATADGLGVEAVEVCAYPLSSAEENSIGCGETDGDGDYTIGGLAPGSYKVEFWTGYAAPFLAYQFWDHESRYQVADVITLVEGEWREGVDADLEPAATISGNLVNLANGSPPEEVRVCAIDAVNDTLTVCTWTDEAGNYSMGSLPAGSFKVVFSPELSEFFPDNFFAGEEDDGFPTQFWDNQGSIAAANVISLGVGGTASGINARFGTPQVSAPVTTPARPPIHKRRKCRRGFRKKLVKGKRRCVKVRKHRRHPHRRHPDKSAQRFFAR